MNIHCSQLCKTPTRITELPFYRPCMPLNGLDSAPRHEDVWWSGCIVPRILKLYSAWRWVISLTSRSVWRREEISLCPSNKRLDGSQSWSYCGRFGEEKNLLTLPGIEPTILRLSTHTLATMSITLIGVGQAVEGITCRSLSWILKQVPGVTGLVFL